MTDIRCPDCGSMRNDFIGHLPDRHEFAGKPTERALKGGALYRCKSCALKFRHPIFTTGTYELLYDNACSGAWAVNEGRQDQMLVLKYLQDKLPGGGKVLDVGCYTGHLLGALNPRFERFGVELNTAAAEVARRVTHAAIWNSLDEIPSDRRFEAILAIDVIEHMPSPRRFVEALSKKLSDGGVVILSTGDGENFLWKILGADWWYCSYAEHLAFISEQWLKFHAVTTGLEPLELVRFRYTAASFSCLECTAFAFYAAFPRVYRAIIRSVRRAAGRAPEHGTPGAGISRDHLFVVLHRRSSQS